NSTPVGHSLQLTGNGSSYADFTWQAPASETFGACNTGQSFGPAVDHPPFVLSITPEDGGTMSANGTIALVFSEPVTVADDWIRLVCEDSGFFDTDVLAISGGPTSYTIEPPQDLFENELCTISLETGQITDASDQPLDPPSLFEFT